MRISKQAQAQAEWNNKSWDERVKAEEERQRICAENIRNNLCACGKPPVAMLATRREGGHFGQYPYGTGQPEPYCQKCLDALASAYTRGYAAIPNPITWLGQKREEEL